MYMVDITSSSFVSLTKGSSRVHCIMGYRNMLELHTACFEKCTCIKEFFISCMICILHTAKIAEWLCVIPSIAIESSVDVIDMAWSTVSA